MEEQRADKGQRYGEKFSRNNADRFQQLSNLAVSVKDRSQFIESSRKFVESTGNGSESKTESDQEKAGQKRKVATNAPESPDQKLKKETTSDVSSAKKQLVEGDDNDSEPIAEEDTSNVDDDSSANANIGEQVIPVVAEAAVVDEKKAEDAEPVDEVRYASFSSIPTSISILLNAIAHSLSS
jgi:hypothetical protein